jgi:Putative peptidoglycan binding domain
VASLSTYGRKITHWLCVVVFLSGTIAYANEQVRAAQEELRRRNLYFGDVDGQLSPDLANALKHYQARKGFEVTGTITEETADSLNVPLPATMAATQSATPEGPILRSDRARQLPETERVALQKQGEENPDVPAIPAPPAEEPAPGQDLAPERIRTLVENYLRDGETSDIPAQTRYFAYPVDYFVHGMKGPDFVENDVRNYVKRWPQRKYAITGPITFVAAEKEGETTVAFDISYSVHRPNASASGWTRNIWTIRTEGDELKILAIHEQRIRPAGPTASE